VKLLNGEEATSLCVISFGDDLSTPYIAVGTAIVLEDDDTPRSGRIILFRYKNGHINMITEKEVNGAPYGMLPYHDKLLVTIGNTVRNKFSRRILFFVYQFLDSIVSIRKSRINTTIESISRSC
jgi:hypothetical protein